MVCFVATKFVVQQAEKGPKRALADYLNLQLIKYFSITTRVYPV